MTKNFQSINIIRSDEVIGAFQYTQKYYEKTITLGRKLTIRYKKVQEWIKIISISTPLRVKRENDVCGWEKS